MPELFAFNKLYTSDDAKRLRNEISDIMFNIQYFQLRINKLQQELEVKNKEYTDLFKEYIGDKENGKDETKCVH